MAKSNFHKRLEEKILFNKANRWYTETAFIFFLPFLLNAQTIKTVAVLDFNATGLSVLEVQTLNQYFISQVSSTGDVAVLERTEIDSRITGSEYEGEASSCYNPDCALEIGRVIDVSEIILGAVVQEGDEFRISITNLSIADGQTVFSRDVIYRGLTDGLITEIQILAWEAMGRAPPEELMAERITGAVTADRSKSKVGAMIRSAMVPGYGQLYSGKKLWAGIWLGAETVAAGLIAMSYNNYLIAYDDYNKHQKLYNDALDPDVVSEHKDNALASLSEVESANDQIKLATQLAAAVWLGNIAHAYLVGPGRAGAATSSISITPLVFSGGSNYNYGFKVTIGLD